MKINIFYPESRSEARVHMTYVLEGFAARVKEEVEKQPIKAGDFALVCPAKKTSTAKKAIYPSN